VYLIDDTLRASISAVIALSIFAWRFFEWWGCRFLLLPLFLVYQSDSFTARGQTSILLFVFKWDKDRGFCCFTQFL